MERHHVVVAKIFGSVIFQLLALTCFCLHARGVEPTSSSVIREELKQIYPTANLKTVTDEALLPGIYKTHVRLGANEEIYLFSDHRYALLQHSDLGTCALEGNWSFKDGELNMVTSNFGGIKAGINMPAIVIAVLAEGRSQLFLVERIMWAISSHGSLYSSKEVADLISMEFAVVTQESRLSPDESVALRSQYDEKFGRYNFPKRTPALRGP